MFHVVNVVDGRHSVLRRCDGLFAGEADPLFGLLPGHDDGFLFFVGPGPRHPPLIAGVALEDVLQQLKGGFLSPESRGFKGEKY